MKKEPDIRPWNEKHTERRKTEPLLGPMGSGMGKPEPHPCLTVPSEMHQQMVDERDKKIAELQKYISDEKEATRAEIRRQESQPAREGWIERWFLWILLIVAVAAMSTVVFLYRPAAPKGTGETGQTIIYHSDVMDERDHWLKNCRAAWKELNCGNHPHPYYWSNDEEKAACQALDQ